MTRYLSLLIALCLPFFSATTRADEPLPVVASFSILADLTRQVGGDRVRVHSLVGENGDAHAFQPTPADAKFLGQARLVIVNGLGFEGWIDRLVKSSGYRGKIVVASQGVKILKRQHTQGHHHDGHQEEADPHAWQDAINALQYVDNIAGALSQADLAGQPVYERNARRFKQEIQSLDESIRKSFQAIPEDQRRVVTSHDAFGYFARAYGIRFISPVGVNADAEPSAGDVARIIRQVRSERIPAVFLENIRDSRMLERIRRESGARVGGTLYSDSLSKREGPASTYLDMMRYNSGLLVSALSR